LLLAVLDFERIVNNAFEKRTPDVLANYTYDLCQLINTFYHNCPILRDDVDADTRAHRLGIVRVALSTLSKAIDLMGLKIPEEM
jgi:arginyl-tRNA synthetase